MTRTPLRPLARILSAREKGENPDAIERENRRLRHEAMRDGMRHRAEGRLLVLALFFLCAYSVIGVRMGMLAAGEPTEVQAASAGSEIVAQRANIVDRNGRILATNLSTHSLYAQTRDLVDPAKAARDLVEIFPDLDEADLLKDLTGSRHFIWIKKKLSPEQMQRVHDIGEPGLLFGPREMRLYPNGRLAAHVLGGTRFGREGVGAAEVIGTAGVEKKFDTWLRDPANDGAPLELSLDLTVQSATREVLLGGMKLMNAKGASAVLMDVDTGEIVTMVSLPDFDPNDRPPDPISGDPGDSPTFNRAVQGLYELGSVFKIFTAAQALELGLVHPATIIDAKAPMKWGKFKIKEFRGKNYGKISVTDVIVNSSNVGTAKLALAIGGKRQRAFLETLGFLDPTELEVSGTSRVRPQQPERWTEISTITISYGHGLSSSPVHLAAGYASLLNGGTRVTPTLLRRDAPEPGPRVVSERTSRAARKMLREVVSRGTASFGEVPGYAVGGKTGTADKPTPNGRYYKDKVISTFASVFPADDPEYVLIVTLDEPVETSGSKPRRTAGWTAVPVAAEIIRRTAPLLGVHPRYDPEVEPVLASTSN